MFLYELAVEDLAQPRHRPSRVRALADLARERGCYGMCGRTDDGNPAALRAYAAAGGVREQPDRACRRGSSAPSSTGTCRR